MNPSNMTGPVLWDVDGRGVATVTLNRPEVNNAYNGELIEGLLAALDALGSAKGLRAVVIRGNGKHFQAGADLKWIDAVRTSPAAENVRVSRATAEAVARVFSSGDEVRTVSIHLRSAPAWKCLPLPLITTARSPAAAPSASSAASRPSIIAPL